MEQKFDKVICSDSQSTTGYFQISSGHISQTVILFEKENIIARVQAKGEVSFCDPDGKLLAAGAVPAQMSGREVYEELSCRVENNKLMLLFPIYEWMDTYPNCDGEHDRWITKRVGAHTLTFDMEHKTVTVA